MPDQSEKDQPQRSQDDQNAALAPIELAQRAFQAALNLQFDTARQLSELAQAKAAAVGGPEGELVRGMTGVVTAIIDGFAIPFRDTDPERFQRAVKHLDGARDRLEEFRNHFPDKTQNPEFASLVTAVEIQRITAAGRSAREAGDQRQVLICDAQLKNLIATMPEHDRTQQQGMIAFHRLFEIVNHIRDGTAALADMDLGRALRVIAEVSRDLNQTATVIRQNRLPGALFQHVDKLLDGALDRVEALEAYAQVLYNAIVGDVPRAHVNLLAKAEERLHSGSKKTVEGLIVVGKLKPQDAQQYQAALEAQIVPMRNLRALCLESLKPRSWLASASLKFVIVFLVTTIALVVVVALTSASQGTAGSVLTGYIVLVSFVAALIGGFGTEALRFLPFVKHLSASLPGTPSKDKPKGD
jgi:hypothetical protein